MHRREGAPYDHESALLLGTFCSSLIDHVSLVAKPSLVDFHLKETQLTELAMFTSFGLDSPIWTWHSYCSHRIRIPYPQLWDSGLYNKEFNIATERNNSFSADRRRWTAGAENDGRDV